MFFFFLWNVKILGIDLKDACDEEIKYTRFRIFQLIGLIIHSYFNKLLSQVPQLIYNTNIAYDTNIIYKNKILEIA